MERILFLGTCSGTEPIEGMCHTSFMVDVNGTYYMFDAGESSSRTAVLMGVSFLKVKSIFISHCHIDHIGGLANALFCIQKRQIMTGDLPINNNVDIYIPDLDCWEAVKAMLHTTTRGYKSDYTLTARTPKEGVFFEDENIKVTAVRNRHLETFEKDLPLSFSYIIEVVGKRIVFSGDVKNLEDVEPLVEQECDYLLMETGHHKVLDILEFTKNHKIGKLMFIHHGREIINHADDAQKLIDESGLDAKICRDEDILIL